MQAPAARTRRRRAVAVAALAGSLLFLTACETSIETGIDVADGGSYAATASLRFDGAIAETLAGDGALRDQLETALETTFADVDVVESGVRYDIPLPPARIGELAGLTGVASVTTTVDDAGEVTVAVAVARPERLVETVAAAVADWPDGPQVLATIATAVQVAVEVRFPGPVTAVDGFTVDGGTARYVATIAELTTERTLVVTGPGAGGGSSGMVRWVVAGGVLAVLGYVALRRERR